MSWTRYFLHDYFTAKELDRIDHNLRRLRSSRARSDSELRDRIDELEDDLARLTLLVHAMAETCVRKGLLSRKEISRMADELDLLDGCADGKLDPGALPGARRRERTGPVSPEEHLRNLEKREPRSPGEFLSDLEDQH
jgi:hypothetical protein